MAALALRSEERLGLALALAAHVALVGWLMLAPRGPAPLPPPERMTVTLSDDVALTSTAPQPASAPAAATAPVTADEVAEPVPPQPQPSAAAQPRPAPAPQAKPQPRPVVAKTPSAPAKPSPPAAKPQPPAKSRIGADFLPGPSTTKSPAPNAGQPAAAVGPAVKAALAAAILRQVKPRWQGRVPQGVDTEKLVSIIAISLNPDGSLAAKPQLLGQEGVNDANRAQAGRHGEEAIRAVELAAPFNLPAELYQSWKKPPPLRMRKSL